MCVCVCVSVCVYEHESRLGKVRAGGEVKDQRGKAAATRWAVRGAGDSRARRARAAGGAGRRGGCRGGGVEEKNSVLPVSPGHPGVSSPQLARQPRRLARLPAALAGSGALLLGPGGAARSCELRAKKKANPAKQNNRKMSSAAPAAPPVSKKLKSPNS